MLCHLSLHQTSTFSSRQVDLSIPLSSEPLVLMLHSSSAAHAQVTCKISAVV